MPIKQSEAKPAEKLLTLYVLLLYNSGRPFSLSDLAARLECSKQTVLRLIDQLEVAEYGKISRNKQGREAIYCIERPRNLPMLQLNAEGLCQLALCRNLLLHLLPKGMRAQVDKTLREAGAYADNPVAPDAVVIGQPYTKGRVDYVPFQEMLATFTRGIQEKKVCIVTYKPRIDRDEYSFEFAPKRLIAYHETMLLVGWKVKEKGLAEALYDDPMPLYLHRCKMVTLTRRTTEHLPEPEPAQNNEGVGPFGIIQGKIFGVTVYCAREASTYVHERIWSDNQKVEILPDGSVILHFDAQSELEVISWVLSFGDRMTVREPEWLQAAVFEQAKAVAQKYADLSK